MWAAAIAGVVALVLVAAGTALALAADDGPSRPSAWAPEVADLVPFVEKAKGASFEHAVKVVVLDDEEFRDRVTRDQEDLTAEDTEELERTEGELRALGLHGGTGSLFDQMNVMMGGGTAAFYDPNDEEIVIPRGDDQALADRQSLVHELTHALQDQLGQLDEPEDSDAAQAHLALVEGEAKYVETQWADSLSASEQAELDEQAGDLSDAAGTELESVNPVLVAMLMSPYDLGEAMVAALDDAGRLDDTFDTPPASFADVQDPARWLEPIDLVAVDEPELHKGEKEQGEADTFGAQALYLMLATAMNPGEALVAADGWGGDRMVSYESAAGADCMRVAVTGIDADATTRIADAVGTWVADRPQGSASSSTADGVVTFDACDPGSSEGSLTDGVANLPGIRASFVSQFQLGGLSFPEAVCASTQLVGAFEPDFFYLDALDKTQDRAVRAAVDRAYDTCRS